MKKVVGIVFALALFSNCYSQEPTRWRGPSGNGIYHETELLKKWPANGPEILWSYENLGQGHSSVVVDRGFVYATGMIDKEGFLFKFDLTGTLVYKKAYGPEYTASHYGTRGSPVIAGDLIYVVSGNGKLYCLSNDEGDIQWSKDLFKEFRSKNISWGINETPVVDGDVIYVTPGGKSNNMVALNRHTGDFIWSSKGKGELTAYCTPLLFEHYGRKILATHTKSHLMGFDANTGEMLWSQPHSNEFSVHANTPIYHEGLLFYFSGYGKGGGLLKLSPGGSSVSLVWEHKKLDSRMGGAVLFDGYIYGSGDYNREWSCLEWKTGKVMCKSNAIAKGAVIYADGMFYCYSETGELALVKADSEGFQVISQTKVNLGSEQHWAHPSIYDGVLYVRHGKAIISYKVN